MLDKVWIHNVAFTFFVNLQQVRPFQVISGGGSITMTWNWDSCSGAINGIF
jgi:hypothetical protein